MIDYFLKLIFLFICLLFINMNTFSKFTHFIINTHSHTHVTAVTKGSIKVTFNETTHNRTLVNSLSDQ